MKSLNDSRRTSHHTRFPLWAIDGALVRVHASLGVV
jgi:hypothetical protein